MRKIISIILCTIIVILFGCFISEAASKSSKQTKLPGEIEPKIYQYTPSEHTLKGLQLDQEEKYEESIAEYMAAFSEDKDGYAAYLIGSKYMYGNQGFPLDDGQATVWFNKSHELGFPLGTFWLGSAYIYGVPEVGVSEDVYYAKLLIQKVEDTVIEVVMPDGEKYYRCDIQLLASAYYHKINKNRLKVIHLMDICRRYDPENYDKLKKDFNLN